MQGLILAAGRGSRLGRYGRDTPKCLLEVARRRLIEHQLEACAEAGVAPVSVVVGYCADEIREVVGIRAEYIDNPRWATTNSIYSFWQARDWIKGPVVVMNCDILFEPAILARLLAIGGDALVYDSRSGSGAEHMKVKTTSDGRLIDMSKGLSPGEATGENVGMLHFSAETARAVLDEAGRIIAAGGENGWLASAVGAVAQNRPIRALDIAGLAWGEIDTAYDLDHVRKKVWPVIARASKRGARWPLRRWALVPVIPFVLGTGLGVLGLSPAAEERAVSWDTVDVAEAPKVEIALPDRKQAWWMLEGPEELRAEVQGPGEVRIESRLVLGDRSRTDVPYVLRVELDGELVDLFKKDGRRDGEAAIVDSPAAIGRRKRMTITAPAGRHTLTIALVGAAPSDRCLIRVRAPEAEVADAE